MGEAEGQPQEQAEQKAQEQTAEGGDGKASEPSVKELQSELNKVRDLLKKTESESIKRKERLRELEDAQKQLEDNKLKENEKWKELAEKREAEINEFRNKIRQDAENRAIESAAIKAGLRDPSLIKLLDKGSIVFDDDTNSIHGVEEAISGLKKNHPYLFSTEKVPPTTRGNEGPSFDETGKGLSMDDIAKMPHAKQVEVLTKMYRKQKSNS